MEPFGGSENSDTVPVVFGSRKRLAAGNICDWKEEFRLASGIELSDEI